MYKRISVLIIVILLSIFLTGCAGNGFTKGKRVEIIRGETVYSVISIPLRDGYTFAETPFNTVDTDNGYDIVIHCTKDSNINKQEGG